MGVPCRRVAVLRRTGGRGSTSGCLPPAYQGDKNYVAHTAGTRHASPRATALCTRACARFLRRFVLKSVCTRPRAPRHLDTPGLGPASSFRLQQTRTPGNLGMWPKWSGRRSQRRRVYATQCAECAARAAKTRRPAPAAEMEGYVVARVRGSRITGGTPLPSSRPSTAL